VAATDGVTVDALPMTIPPGIVLAFVKLIFMLNRRTWHVAAMYLAILLLPFLGTTAVFHRECPGTREFNRGCRAAVSTMWHEKFRAGREGAKQHRLQRMKALCIDSGNTRVEWGVRADGREGVVPRARVLAFRLQEASREAARSE
jgi:hypothetical protein